MDTLEIDRALAKVPGFLGAHAFNELPEKPNGDYSLVVNTNAEQGEHWLAIVRKHGTNYFIDSFGRPPSSSLFSKDFRETIKSYVGAMKYNKEWFQSLTSNACGMYCVYFISELEKNSFINIFKVFSDNFEKNDEYVEKYLYNNINI